MRVREVWPEMERGRGGWPARKVRGYIEVRGD